MLDGIEYFLFHQKFFNENVVLNIQTVNLTAVVAITVTLLYNGFWAFFFQQFKPYLLKKYFVVLFDGQSGLIGQFLWSSQFGIWTMVSAKFR